MSPLALETSPWRRLRSAFCSPGKNRSHRARPAAGRVLGSSAGRTPQPPQNPGRGESATLRRRRSTDSSGEIPAFRASSRSRWACSSGSAIVKAFIGRINLDESQLPLNLRCLRTKLGAGPTRQLMVPRRAKRWAAGAKETRPWRASLKQRRTELWLPRSRFNPPAQGVPCPLPSRPDSSQRASRS